MKKTVVFRCNDAMEVKHAANFFSRVATLGSVNRKNVTMMEMLMHLGEWSNEQDILPNGLKEQVDVLVKKREDMLQLFKNGQLEAEEFDRMVDTMLNVEKLICNRILENEDIYPCVGIMLVDSELPKGQKFKFAFQTAKTAGYELVEKLPGVNQGITDMWQCVWETTPGTFMDLTFLAAQKVETMGGELLAIMKRILDNEILPEGMSKENFNVEFKSYFQFLKDGCLGYVSRMVGLDDSDDKD